MSKILTVSAVFSADRCGIPGGLFSGCNWWRTTTCSDDVSTVAYGSVNGRCYTHGSTRNESAGTYEYRPAATSTNATGVHAGAYSSFVTDAFYQIRLIYRFQIERFTKKREPLVVHECRFNGKKVAVMYANDLQSRFVNQSRAVF